MFAPLLANGKAMELANESAYFQDVIIRSPRSGYRVVNSLIKLTCCNSA